MINKQFLLFGMYGFSPIIHNGKLLRKVVKAAKKKKKRDKKVISEAATCLCFSVFLFVQQNNHPSDTRLLLNYNFKLSLFTTAENVHETQLLDLGVALALV